MFPEATAIDTGVLGTAAAAAATHLTALSAAPLFKGGKLAPARLLLLLLLLLPVLEQRLCTLLRK